MFSSRLPATLTPNALARAVAALGARRSAIVDLTASNPTSEGFHYPDRLLEPLGHAEALVYQPDPLGLPPAREAVAAEYARHGLSIPVDRLVLTASTSEAYSFLFKLLCDPGDNVLVPQPSYPLFEHLTRLDAVRAVPYALECHGAWRIDLDRLREAADRRTRAVLVVSPNNPTGSFLHEGELVTIAEWCASQGMTLIGDEVFADYPLDALPGAARVLAQDETLTCSLGGLSKSVGLPQVKLGWIAFGGPGPDLRAALARCELIADTYLSVSTPVQLAASRLIAAGAAVRSQIQTRLRRNLDRLRALAAVHPSVTVLRVEGGWSAVLQVPSIAGEDALVLALLEHDGVLVHPGYFFDFPREAFIVISLIVEPARFDRGIAHVLARAAAPERP